MISYSEPKKLKQKAVGETYKQKKTCYILTYWKTQNRQGDRGDTGETQKLEYRAKVCVFQ